MALLLPSPSLFLKLSKENFTSWFGRAKIAPKSVPHVQHSYIPPSTNEKSLICGVDVAVAVVISLGSFSIDDGDGNDNATNKQFDWSS